MKKNERGKAAPEREKASLGERLEQIRQSPFRPILWILAIVVIVLLDILLAGNNLHTFAIILGIEIVLLAIIGWTKYLVGRIRQEREEQNENYND